VITDPTKRTQILATSMVGKSY